MSVSLFTADEVDQTSLHGFLARFFSKAKANFLRDHGKWMHGGDSNRWILKVDDEIAGYCAVIPTKIVINNEIIPAMWWVDIIIAPEFRGRGLQSHFDRKITENDLVKVGFPNELAAKIHRKHGWGVREDLTVMLAPLQPLKVGQVKRSHGFRKLILTAGALILTPIVGVFKFWLKRRNKETAYKVENPSADELASVFNLAHRGQFSTTYRDKNYFQNRFFDSPYREELSFYFSGPKDAPIHYLITRTLKRNGLLITRILDAFGDFSDRKAFRDLVFCALSDAAMMGSTQVTVMVTLRGLSKIYKRLGFLFKSQARFCWHSSKKELMDALQNENYWTIADSDNDEIT
jgi:hypothetical protein